MYLFMISHFIKKCKFSAGENEKIAMQTHRILMCPKKRRKALPPLLGLSYKYIL